MKKTVFSQVSLLVVSVTLAAFSLLFLSGCPDSWQNQWMYDILHPGGDEESSNYTIVLQAIDGAEGDSVSFDEGGAVFETTAEVGETLTLYYTLADADIENLLDFSVAIESVEEAGSGTREYTVSSGDSSGDNTIVISAVFVHTDLGSGTEEDPFRVFNVETLSRVGKPTNGGDYDGWTLDKWYLQIRDIDMSGETWEPIGDNSDMTDDTRFTGNYNGGGFAISSLSINAPNGKNQGLFGYIGTGGAVQKVNLSGVSITGLSIVGGIASFNMGTITDCSVSGSVKGGSFVGGITAGNHGAIENCSVSGSVISTDVGYIYTGGIAGSNSGTITGCSFTGGSVTSEGSYVGGIAGTNDGTIGNCYSSGDVSSSFGESIGGIAGVNYGTVEKCYSSGTISGTGDNVGGIAGNNTGNIKNCYSTGAVSGGIFSKNIGGIAGQNRGTVQNCYSAGNVANDNTIVGGIVGNNDPSSGNAKVLNCVALMSTVDGAGNEGRIAGFSMSPSSELSNVFARGDMLVNGDPVSSTDNTSKDGADITKANWSSDSFWTGTAQFDPNVWDFTDISATKLPILRNMPAGVQLPTTAPGPDPTVTVSKEGGTPAPYSNLKAALDSITTTGIYTVTVFANQNLAAYSLNVTGADITIEADSASSPKEIQLNNQGSLFTVESGVSLTLENGITLKGVADNTDSLVTVNGGAFYLTGGKITDNNVNLTGISGGGVNVTSGTFTMSGGEISGNAGYGGGGVYVIGGTFTMSGGEISRNDGANDARGGGVYVIGGTFTMTGGKISENESLRGGGVYVSGGTFTMSGGTISGNTATGVAPGTGGGGVYIFGTSTSFDMNGGEISGNTAPNGGGVYMDGDRLMLGGTAKIYGNTQGASGSPNNVYLPGIKYIRLGEGIASNGVAAPAIGMNVHVQTTFDGVIVNSGATAGVEQYFHADEAGKIVYLVGNQLKIAAEFEFNPTTGTITGYNGPGGNVTIPAQIGGVPVTAIGNQAFSGNEELTGVIIPDSVITIGSGAFMYNSDLASVILGNSVETIGDSAFQGCSLTDIIIPDSVQTIGTAAFDDNELKNITIPARVQTIETGAFDQNNITSVTFEGSDTDIEDDAFYNTGNLINTYLEFGAGTYTRSSLNWTKQPLTIDSSMVDISGGTITGYNGPAGPIIIPAQIGVQTVTIIGDDAFSWNNLTSVIIPDSVTSIGNNAFENNGLTSVILGNGVETIGDSAFADNYNMASITIPDSVTSIGNNAFENNGLTSVILGNGVETIGDYAFDGNHLASIIIPNSVTTIGEGAFNNSNLTSVIIPDSVTTIGEQAFALNPLTSVTIGIGVTEIAEQVFFYTQLASITIPANVQTIEAHAFQGSPITSITIEGTGVQIGGWLFSGNNDNLAAQYAAGGPGTYLRPDTNSNTWAKE